MHFTAYTIPSIRQDPMVFIHSILLRLLRALRAAYPVHFWSAVWRFIFQRPLHSNTSPVKDSSLQVGTQKKDVNSAKEELKATVAYTISAQPSLHPNSMYPSPMSVYSNSQSSIGSSSSEIAFNVIPPDPADLEGGGLDPHRIGGRLSSQSGSITLTSTSGEYKANNISRQTFQVHQPPSSTSRLSFVVPRGEILQPEGFVAHPDAAVSTAFSKNEVDEKIYPMMPSAIPRYTRLERKMNYSKDAEFTVQAMQKTFPPGEIPYGWEKMIHPEGQPYFYNLEKRIVTENWICNEDEMELLEKFIGLFEDFSRSQNLYHPPDTYLVLETKTEPTSMWCGYYYVCTSSRSVFWLETYAITNHLAEVKGDISATHISKTIPSKVNRLQNLIGCCFEENYLEYEYWIHRDLFPDVIKATIDDCDLIANIIADARTDVHSSFHSTVNYTTKELKEMANIVQSVAKRISLGRNTTNWYIGRFMRQLMKDRFVNFHGEFGARLNQNQSIYGFKKRPNSWFLKALSPLLFAAPNVHLEIIEELRTDRVTLRARSLEFFKKLNTQWGEHIVHAFILLNANVAFLAIPSNDPSNNSAVGVLHSRSAPQIASYLSIVTSFASVVIGLLLVRQHKTKARTKVEELDEYFRSRYHPTLEFEQLAILYSLPYALITWGMVTFLFAFILMCFIKSTTIACVIVSIVIVLMCVLIGWCITMSWTETEFQWRKRLKEHQEKVYKKFSVMAEVVKVWPRNVTRLSDPGEAPLESAEAGMSQVNSVNQ